MGAPRPSAAQATQEDETMADARLTTMDKVRFLLELMDQDLELLEARLPGEDGELVIDRRATPACDFVQCAKTAAAKPADLVHLANVDAG